MGFLLYVRKSHIEDYKLLVAALIAEWAQRSSPRTPDLEDPSNLWPRWYNMFKQIIIQNGIKSSRMNGFEYSWWWVHKCQVLSLLPSLLSNQTLNWGVEQIIDKNKQVKKRYYSRWLPLRLLWPVFLKL